MNRHEKEMLNRGLAIESACSLLPDGWTITIELESDAGNVSLTDPNGDEREFPSNRERLSEEIRDAIDFAIAEDLPLVEDTEAPHDPRPTP